MGREHDPQREATEAQIEGDERLRRESEPALGGYGAENEEDEHESGVKPGEGNHGH